MALYGLIHTTREKTNKELFFYAAKHLPSIVVDCANFADPHRFYPDIDLEEMQRIYVFELELLHRFRDVLRHLPRYAKEYGIQSIIVTTADHLINYQDEEENENVYRHAWQLMRRISTQYTIVAGVMKDSDQYPLAKKYCHEIWEENKYGPYNLIATHGDRHHSK